MSNLNSLQPTSTKTKLSLAAQILAQDYERARELERDEFKENPGEKIKVHEIPSNLAFLYENVRNVVEYKEEHLLRKNAIERTLARKLRTEHHERAVAESLLTELIRARYLPNNKISIDKIAEVEAIIRKNVLLIGEANRNATAEAANEVFDFVIGIMSCEIEENLAPRFREYAVVDFATNVMKEKIKVPVSIGIGTALKEELIYVAVLRSFIKADLSTVRYGLFVRKNPSWNYIKDTETVKKIAQVLPIMMAEMNAVMDHSYLEAFLRAIKKHLAYFKIINSTLQKQQGDIKSFFARRYALEDLAKESCVETYKIAQSKLSRAAVRSILYIFATKMFIALLVEFPFEKYVLGEVHYLPLAINVIFPVVLMTVVVLSIRVPGKENTQLIVQGIRDILSGEFNKTPFVIKAGAARNSLLSSIFKLAYFFIFIVIFGVIIKLLFALGFNWVSVALFLFFLTLVSYFGIRIRQNARELVVVGRKEGMISFLSDTISMPIVHVGYWLSAEMSQINFLVFIFDFILEAPFKKFLNVFDDWIKFMKEERDKLE